MMDALVRIILISGFVICSLPAFTQTTDEIIVGDYAEPHLSVDPSNPLRMVLGANHSYVAISSDGGINWHPQTLGGTSRGDHVTGFDIEGSVFVMRLTTQSQAMFCKSLNGNEWECDTLPRSGRIDKPWFVVDNRIHTDNLYAVWTEFTRNPENGEDDSIHVTFIRSPNGGQSWEKPIILGNKQYLEKTTWLVGTQVTVGPNGEVFVCWSGTDSIYFCYSSDQGKSFTKPMSVTNHKTVDLEIPSVLRSWSMPVLLCDTTQSQFRGRLYIIYADRTDDGDVDIFETHSDNQGVTWSRSSSITHSEGSTIQYLPAAAITHRGHIICTFMDRRESNLGKPANHTTLYAARSVDGGQSWSNFSLKGPGAEQIADFPGDYMSLAAIGDDLFAAWAIKLGIQESVFLTHWKDSMSAGTVHENDLNSAIRFIRKGGKLYVHLSTPVPNARVALYDMLGRVVFQNEYDLSNGEFWLSDIPDHILRTSLFASIQTKRTNSRPYITIVHP